MLIDGRLMPSGGTLRAAVAVVGAGPAGITVTRNLAAAGIDVLLLESGDRQHGRDGDDPLQGVGSGRPFPLVTSRRRGFGGTSLHWTPATGLRVRPLDEIDFVSLTARRDAWPFRREALDPYYDRAHTEIGLQPGYAPSRWSVDAAESGLSWEGGPQAAMFQFAPHRCFVERFDELVDHPCVDVALHAPVTSITLRDDGSRVSSMTVTNEAASFSVVADVYVVAAGGIDNARLLLASPGRTGSGVGNEHDNVGRYFMDHLSVDSGVIRPAGGRAVDVQPFLERRMGLEAHQAMLWLGDDAIERHGLLNAAFWVNELDPRYLSRGVAAARSLRAAWNDSPRNGVARQLGRTLRHGLDVVGFGVRTTFKRPVDEPVIGLRIMAEQTPVRSSRITLSDRTDRNGLRRVDLDWRVDPTDLEQIRRHQDVLAAELERHGVGTIVDRFEPEAHRSPVMSNFHHLGATRMDDDPRGGVVDAQCRVHGIGNLFVGGSSVFPTGGYLNPTLTIIALAIRIAERIERDFSPTALTTVAPGEFAPVS